VSPEYGPESGSLGQGSEELVTSWAVTVGEKATGGRTSASKAAAKQVQARRRANKQVCAVGTIARKKTLAKVHEQQGTPMY
jgi:hypothetical protein